MAQAFNLTAQLNLRGPRNVNAIVSRINRQLGNINANVNLNINRNTQTAINNVNGALTRLNRTLATTTTNAGNATTAINNLTGALTNMGNLNVNQQLNNAANAAQQLGNNANAAAGGAGGGGGVQNLRTQMEEFGRQSALAVRRFAAFSVVTSIIFGVTNAFNKAFKAFVDFDKEFVRLQQVTGESAQSLRTLSNTITSLAVGLGTSSAELAQVSSTLAQAGLTARDTEKALKALALSALAPSFDNLNNTVEGSIALMRQFGVSAGELESALGSVNAVAAAFAVEAGDIIAAIQRTGGVFASASKGVSEGTDALNEFIAIFTSVRQTTRESAETIATGLRTIFTRIQRSSTIEALKEFNISLTDAEGKFVGAYKAIELLSRGLNSIDPRDLKFSEIVEELGGFRQIGKVIPLIQQFDTAQRALAVAQAGQTSLTEDAAVAQLSLANQFAKVREEFLAMVREIGGTDTFQTLVKGALALASGLIKLADSAKSVLPVIAAITAFRGLGAARQFGRGFIGGLRGAPQGNANGGMIRAYKQGGSVPVALMPGETVVYPEMVSKIGVSKLRKLNHADKKMARGGGVGLVPGKGRTDSFYTSLPERSFVIRTDATKALGGPQGVLEAGLNRKKYARGGAAQLPTSRRYTGETKQTNDKPAGYSIPKALRPGGLKTPDGRQTLLLGRNDSVDVNIQRQPINTTPEERARFGYDAAKNNASLRGIAFEKIIEARGLITRSMNPSARLDGKTRSGNTYAEVRSRGEQTPTKTLLDKVFGAIVAPRDPMVDAVLSEQASRQKLTSRPDTFRTNLLVFEDRSVLKRKPREQEEFKDKFQKRGAQSSASGKKAVAARKAAFGGFIQKFGRGSVKPLEGMGRKDLIEEARNLGVSFGSIASFQELGMRGEAGEAARRKLIQRLEEERTIVKTKQAQSTTKATGRQVAVVGLSASEGVRGSSKQVVLPGGQDPKTGRKQRDLDATLNIGALEGKTAQRSEAVLRNSSIRGSMRLAKILATSAGESASLQSLQDQIKLRQKLKNVPPEMMGFGLQSALLGLQGQATPSGSADLAKGLSAPYANMFGVPEKIPTDVTYGGKSGQTLEREAMRKATGTRRSKKGRSASQLRRAFVKRKIGGLTNAPLIDDIAGDIPGTYPPIPTGSKLDPAIQKLISAGGGMLDYDGTLMKHTGDEAYARAKTPAEKEAVLSKYYRSEKDRISSGRPTKFAKELEQAVKKGLLKPENLSIVSQSKRLPVVEQDIISRFGIPKDNLIFTQGESKAKAVEAFRTKGPRASRVKRAAGGDIPIMAQAGEYVINKDSAQAIGYGNLETLNKYHSGGIVGRYADGDIVASRTSSGAVQFDKSRVTLAKEILELAKATGSGATTLKQAFTEAGAKMDAAVAALPSASAAKTAERAAQKGANVALTPKNPALMPGVPGSKVPAQTGFDKTQTAAPTRLERVTQNITNRMVKAWRETGQTGIDAAAKVKQTYDRVYQAEFKKSAKALKAGNDIAKLEQAKRQAEARALLVATQVASKQNNLPGVSRQKKGAFGGATFKATTAATQFVISGGMDEANKNAKRQNARANRGRGLGLGQRMQLSGAQKIGGGFISSTMGEAQMGIGKAIAGVNSSLTSLRNSLTRSGSGFGRTLNSASTASKNYINSINKAPGLFSKLTAAFNPLTKALNSAAGSAFSFGRRNRSGAGGGAGGAAGGSAGRQRGGMGGGIGMGLMFGIPMIADMLAGGEPTSEKQAAEQGIISGAATGAGIGAMFGPIGMVAGALTGFGMGLLNAQKNIDKFTINKAKMTIEDNGEKISKVLEDVAKAGKATPVQLEELNRALASSVEASLQASEAMTPKRGFGQMLTEAFTAAYLGGDVSLEGSGSQMARSAIYEKQGFMGLIQAQLGGAGVEEQMFQQIAPSIAREAAKGFAAVAAQARTVFEQQFKSGQSITDIMNAPEWSKQSEVLARSNAAVQEQLLLIQASNTLTDKQKEALSKNLIATEAETQLRKQFAEVKAAEDLKKLQSSINRVSFSFNRMLGNMDAAIQRSVDSLAQFNENISLAAASASGQAKVGSSGGIDQILNVLKNPQAYGGTERSAAFTAASASFGSQSSNIQSILGAGSDLESNVISTINRTLSGTQGETDESVANKITSAIKAQLKNLQIPPAIADKLSKQIGQSVAKLRTSGEDSVSFTDLVEQVPELAKSIDIFKNTSDAASRALESVNKSFDMLADATNQYIDLIVESNSRLRAAQSIVAKGSMDLKRALGGNVSLGERRSAIEAPIRSMTGGATDPAVIAANQRRLEADRVRLQSGRDQAARAQDVGAVRAFDDQLAQTSIGLRENVAALKQMADSSELASAALEEIDKAQKKQQAGIGIMEKLVTSTPKELSKMNQAFVRLDANMRGVAIGGTSPEQRKETLDAFQMIAPFLGDQEKGLQANVLQSMLMESGVGISPMMQQILDGMRNPQADPQQALAIATYQQAIDTQARANEELSAMNMQLADDISKKTGDAVANAIANTRIQFEKKQIEDLINRINVVPTANNPAATLASGGIVYKALGGNIDRTVFKPKGTDTVPAMLTPGEFVVNRKATQSNLPLLQSINNGYSKGGKVKYLANGGEVASSNILKDEAAVSNVMATGISTTKLPALDPKLIPNSVSYIAGLEANAFSSLSGPEGPNSGMKKFMDNLRETEQSDYSIPLDSYSTPVLGFAPESEIKIKRRRMQKFFSGGEYVFPEVQPKGSILGAQTLSTLANLPFDETNTKLLSTGTNIDPITQTKLNNRESTLRTALNTDTNLEAYGKLNISDIQNADNEFTHIATQIRLMDAILIRLGEMRNLDNLSKKFVSNATDIPPVWTPPKKVEDLQPGPLNPNSPAVDGVFMYPQIRSQQGAAVTLSHSSSSYPGSTEYKWGIGISNERVYGNLKTGAYEVPSQTDVKPEDLKKMQSSLDAYIDNIDKARNALESTDDAVFSGTSDAQQRIGSMRQALGRIYYGKMAGLYETIPINSQELADGWKGILGDGPLHIFSNNAFKSNDWDDAINRAKSNADTSFKNKFSELKGYKVSDPNEIELSKGYGVAGPTYSWLSGNTDTVKTFVDKFFKAQQRQAAEAYKSPFDIEAETKTATFDTGIPLNKLDVGLGEGTLKAAYGYRLIKDMPKLFPNNGFLVGNERIQNGLLLESGITPETDKQTISDILRMPEGQIGIAFKQQDLESQISTALSDYILNKNIGASITGLTSARRITTADASWIPSSEKNAFGIMGEIDPIQIDEMVRNFKNNSLISGGGDASRIVGAQIAPIGDPLAASVALLNNVVGPTFGTLQKFGYGLYPLTAAAQIGQYAEGLMSLSKSFGQRIVSPQDGKVDPTLATVWGRVTAVGETMGLIAKNDMAGLSRKIGLAQAFAGGSAGIANLVQQVVSYADFLSKQGRLMAGVSGQAATLLQGTVGGDQIIPAAGAAGRSINDIFKEATEGTIDQDGKISNKKSTPPKNLLDIGKKALNPYNSFAQPNDRASLLKYIGDQLMSQRLVNNDFMANWNGLRDYLFRQDTVLSDPDPAKAMNAQISDLTKNYVPANRVLLALTNGEFGQLPNVQKILELAAFRKSQEKAKEDKAKEDSAKMSSGGVVYASNGTLVNYQPRGTDTVPAMLTPGEFVVNRSATQKHLPLLRAINGGSNSLSSIASSFNTGGLVNYLNNGGIILPKYYQNSGTVTAGNAVAGSPQIKLDAKQAGQQITQALTTGVNTLNQVLKTFGLDSAQLNALNGFVNGLQAVTTALSNINITPVVKFEMAPVQVNITGANGLTEAAQSIVDGAIKNAFGRLAEVNNQSKIEIPDEYR